MACGASDWNEAGDVAPADGSLIDCQPPEMAVPASFNDIAADAAVRDHFGDVWYQTTVRVPRGWDGPADRAALRVGDAPGHGVGERRGGGLRRGRLHPVRGRHHRARPRRRAGAGHRRGEQHADLPDHPAGRDRGHPGGKRQRYWHDFFNYAGIHRSGLAVSTAGPPDRYHRRDRPRRGNGTVEYTVEADGADGAEVRVVLRDADGRRGGHWPTARADAARCRTCTGRPPATATSTTSRCSWSTDDAVVDSYHQSVGVRTVEVGGIEFLINGEPFHFTGFGMHEDIAVARQRPQRRAIMLHDFELLKWIGANSFRTSHYPYAEDVLDYADRHGIVLIDETAAVGLNMGLGGGSSARRPTRPSPRDRQ